MSTLRQTTPPRARRRRAPRPLVAALVELLRAHRPPTPPGEDTVWVCLTPATAAAIARVAARRDGSRDLGREHLAHEAARGPLRVSATAAAQWCADAWQAADEGLMAAEDALALAAQIDPRGVA